MNENAPAIMHDTMFRFEQLKNQNESLKLQAVDSDDTVIDQEAATEDRYLNSEARAADNTEEEMSRAHSSIVTSACVAYRCAINRNPSQASERANSVVYDVPFGTY